MKITTYKNGDEIKIIQLFSEVFGRNMDMDFWQWRFARNPLGKQMIRLMWDGQKLVGHYAVSPVLLSVEGAPILTGLSMTTMTHPAYNGRGIFSSLAEELYQSENNENNLQAIWGYPNNNSHAGFIKNLKWVNLPVVPTFSTFPKDWLKLHSEKLDISTINSFSEEHEKAYNYMTDEFKVKVLKNADYLNWRYTNHPVCNYTIFEFKSEGGYYFAVTKPYETGSNNTCIEIDIVEFVFPNHKEIIIALLKSICLHYKKFEIAKINLWIPLNDQRHLTLEKLGFKNDLPITYMGVKALNKDISKLIYNGNNWYFTMGDSDVF
ncbi:GNAT family N-acetyltransferase [Sphingobacteriales bacterium UPWRP_1]|nr:hypothetical protein B6N25_04045 [Sphingobacteriales bacterium TSM_CSS]PSJ76693.1 GNAT family N-acetyltransferase [Sphingobacteriales bacterium UPWRP_1]